MNLAEILIKEKIQIEENISNVVQYGKIDMENIKKSEEFKSSDYFADNLDNEYGKAKTRYSIYKDNNILYHNLSEKDVRGFLKNLEEKYNEI